ncbi:hypothetical protein CANARDRAFT_27894 [[Candida] arabinofermentans NRRL YB-2248]|uniref:Major facilitator superfamily (MFS) profile domain-containing protein n=1 Tax=[Candida] arabinofermentans NRRL YB-2248 TaxID=983967 RepID=A0A1E4T242_9ASCO|nr:hypothetical protein CANARDRAFT_27894 [[Candida] arabinofermentans NRRL YB-2248]
MSSIIKGSKAVYDYFKVDDPSTIHNEYSDSSKYANITRKPVPEHKASNFFQAFNLYPSNYSAVERKFLLKVDFSVFFFLCASFYTKYLDNSNISNAYVSGMKEDLKLHGNQLNYFNTCYTVGYAVFHIPLVLLIRKQSFARYLLIVCEFVWGSLTLANAYVTDANQVYVIRFFIGVFEACSFPATYLVFSLWYDDTELFRRAGLYGMSAVLGSATSGFFQTRAQESLNGVNGLEGWRWQFIIDSIFTYGIVVWGFLFFPGLPTTCRKFGLFNEDDMVFARKRLENKVAIPGNFTREVFRKTFKTWQFYVLCCLWVTHHQIWYDSGAKLYLKSKPELYSQSDVTNYAAYFRGGGIFPALLVPPLAHYYGKMKVTLVAMGFAYFSNIVLLIWNVPEKLKLTAYGFESVFQSGLAQMFYSWATVLCRDNVEKKALVLACMNCFSYAVNAFAIPLQWNLEDSPRFRKGFSVNMALLVVANILFLITYYLDKYDLKWIPQYAGDRHNLVLADKQDALEEESDSSSVEIVHSTLEKGKSSISV